jgi:hypothetical protein
MSQEVAWVKQRLEPCNERQHKSCHKLPPCNTQAPMSYTKQHLNNVEQVYTTLKHPWIIKTNLENSKNNMLE